MSEKHCVNDNEIRTHLLLNSRQIKTNSGTSQLYLSLAKIYKEIEKGHSGKVLFYLCLEMISKWGADAFSSLFILDVTT